MSLIPIPLDFFTCAFFLFVSSGNIPVWWSPFMRLDTSPVFLWFFKEYSLPSTCAVQQRMQTSGLRSVREEKAAVPSLSLLATHDPRDWYQNLSFFPARVAFIFRFNSAATTGPPLSYFQILLWFRSSVGLSWLQAPRSSIFYTSTSTPLWLIDSPQHKGRGADLAFLHIFTQTEFVRAHLFFRYWSGKS